ncbi:HpcH/HpaI aldolase/citrate lyase family protein [Sciscionella sediminilitoris]|uniref:HpcH/HpaI aldolase/citrate lyase family protein n=1 Tax=Sciscionella sediminilitoris TaxID=1445613 RepID=UPI00068BDE33|nr:CoA ester lyase [Sciscionella sp. SE31]
MTGYAFPLTLLYVPATRPDQLRKALRSGADVVILDLEDAIAPSAKESARRMVLDSLAELAECPPDPVIQVRVNPVRTDLGQRDLLALAEHPAVEGVRLPKVEGPDDVAMAEEFLCGDTAPDMHCLIESAAGLERAAEIAATRGVASIALGEADLMAELRLTEEQALTWARGRMVIAAAAAGLPPPVMSAYTELDDDAGLAESCRCGRAFGFWGRAAIHPRQLPVIRAAFAPSAAEIRRAEEILAAMRDAEAHGVGAVRLPDGRFVDRAVALAAYRCVQEDTEPGEDEAEEGR